VIEGQIGLRNPRVFDSAEEWRKFADSFRKGRQPANGDAIRAQLESEGHDGLVIKRGGVGDATPEGGDFHLSFNNRNVNVATPAAKTGQIPTMQADELEQLRLKHGARDASRKHWSGVSEDTTRATTPAPDTGQLSKRSNLLSTEAHDRIENKVNDMVAAGASDTELAAYADNANTQKATDYIHILIRSALKKAGRPMFAIGAAAAGGASLRKALVDQLGGSGKQDQ
jgi:hypothetical protein